MARRALAVRVLTRVLSDRHALDEALAALGGEVSGADRAWLQEVCSGTLRWKGRLDYIVDSLALKKKPTGWLRKVLLIGAYQLVAQDRIQPGMVVSETVDEVRKKEGEAPAKFANASLRKIADHAADFRALPFPERKGEGIATAAQWASLPEWLWAKIAAGRGEAWARAYAQASLERPVLWARAQSAVKNVAYATKSAEEGPVPGSFRPSSGGSVQDLPGFREGEVFIQDISSQVLIAEISAEVQRALGRRDLAALDLCAAPGGKSAGMAWNGFRVTATDRPESGEARFKLLEQTVARVAPEQIRVVPRSTIVGLEAQDLVWVDAPCSGSGILRRHPDVRWLRDEKELVGLLKIQAELIQEAWQKVRPGGFLAYSVCSVLPEEGAQQIEKASLGGRKVREWLLCPQDAPHGDGFWAVLLQK